jgi:CopG family nickel-responsive transcriptional regulator
MALVRQSFSIESSLLERMETLAQRRGYSNRSEFLRDLIRDGLVQERWREDARVLGTLTLVYDHAAHQLGRRLTSVQHDHHEIVLASTHVHLDARLCAEMIMMRGNAGDLYALADALGKQKGVYHAALALSGGGEDLA